VEPGGKLGYVAVNIAGVIVSGRLCDLLRKGRQLLYKLFFLWGVKFTCVHCGNVRHGVSVLSNGRHQRAYARVGVLDVINRIFAVLPHGQVKIELHRRGRTGIEKVPCRVHRYLVQKVGEGYGLAGALGHTHHLSAPHELNQLHEDDVQPVLPVQAQSVHGTLQAGHMAVMVGAPDVYDLVEAALFKFVAVVGDVGGKICVESVGPAQHVVLQVQLFYLLVRLSLLFVNLGEYLRGLQPHGAVLFIGITHVGKLLHSLLNISGLVQLRFEKPFVVSDAVALQIGFHFWNVYIQTEAGHGRMALLGGLVQIAVAVFVVKLLGELFYVVPVVAVLGKFHGVLAADELYITHLDGGSKFFDLISGVVHIELAPYIVAGTLEN